MRIAHLLLAGATFVAGNAPAATNAEKARATAEAMRAGGGPGGSATAGAKVVGPAPTRAAADDFRPTPMDAPLTAGGLTRITCLFRGTDPYHYQLWLPADYASAPTRARSALFVAAPGGKATMGAMADWIRRHGYIAVLLEESRNGDWEPTVGNFLAAHDDVVKRVRVAEGRKVATGLSGGARACSVFVGLRPGFGGLLFQAAGYATVGPNGASPLPGIRVPAIAATFGEKDPNYAEGPRMKRLFGERMELFEFRGGHQWAPKETVEEALDSIDARLPK
jgi:hypothetical protein